MTTRLAAGRYPKIVERVACVTTPGETIDAVVTEEGIAVNPRTTAGRPATACTFPFRPEATRVRIRGASGQIVVETEIRSVILEFCRRLESDPDCAKVPRQ